MREHFAERSRLRLTVRSSLCGLLLLMAAVSHAQEPSTMSERPSDELVRQWLQGGDPRLAAWGAKAVLDDNRRDLLPEVEATVVRWESRRKAQPLLEDTGHWRGMFSLLDALIQMNGRLPVETLAGMGEGVETARIVLLMRLPWDEAAPVWRALYRPDESNGFGATRVAAQRLTGHPPEGFAADLLKRMTVAAEIDVVSENTGVGMGIVGVVGDCASGAPAGADWPEVGSYALQDKPKHKGAVPLIGGAWPVYVLRKVGRQYSPGVCGGFSALTDAIRDSLLGTMVGSGDGAGPLDLNPRLHVLFRDREQYRTEVVRFVKTQQRQFDRLAAALANRGVLTEEERQGLTLHMTLALQDARAPGGVDLPAIAFRSPVEWAAQ